MVAWEIPKDPFPVWIPARIALTLWGVRSELQDSTSAGDRPWIDCGEVVWWWRPAAAAAAAAAKNAFEWRWD